MKAIDCDTHIFEPRTMWRDYIDPALRDRALSIEDDELGYAWLTWQGKKLYEADVQYPGKPKRIGNARMRRRQGLQCDAPYDDTLPEDYWNPKARLARLDQFGVESSVIFPNYGLLWEDSMRDDVPALCGNMRAHNRWMADNARDGGGRLHGVAHLTLRDQEWSMEEIARLGRDGIHLAMTAPAPVDGKPLSHPDLDPVWSAFEEHSVAPIFHVGNFQGVLHPAWYEGDPDQADRVMDSIFLWVAPAVALANMILNGTLEKHPRLRIGVIELTAHWVPQFLLMLEGATGFYIARHGSFFTDLSLPPSEYFRRQVRVGALPYESPGNLISLVGEDTYMFGSDWPHAEGVADPVGVFENILPSDLGDTARAKLYSENFRWLLGEG
ncbi:MAG: amidohydrolase family protein [Actinomycetota bacterium]|nr:amidohydrolase [Actinomycetota bacterium]